MTDTQTNSNTATTKADWTSDQEVRWCPGCGDYSILTALQMLFSLILELKIMIQEVGRDFIMKY